MADTTYANHADGFDIQDGIRAAALLVTLAVLLISIWWGHWAQDMSAIYMAAKMYALGETGSIYAAEDMLFNGVNNHLWNAVLAEQGHHNPLLAAYVYPPFWAALLSPLARVTDAHSFFNLFYLFHIICLFAAIVLSWRIVRPANLTLTTWVAITAPLVITVQPFLNAFVNNQPQFMVITLVLLAIERSKAGSEVGAGVSLGVAAALKIMPLVFVIVFLLRRQWTALAACLMTVALIFAASLALIGVDLHLNFLDQIAKASSVVVLTHISMSFEGLVMWLIGTESANFSFAGRVHLWDKPDWLGYTSKAILLAVLAALTWYMSRLPVSAAYVRLPPLMIIATGYFGPLGWSHYYITAFLFLPVMLQYYGPKLGALLIISLALMANSYIFDMLLAASPNTFLVTWVITVTLILLSVVYLFAPEKDLGEKTL